MSYICYKTIKFRSEAQELIKQANRIITEYSEDGFKLTVRQLYYQFIAHNLFPNDRKWSWTGRRWIRDEHGTKNAEPNYKWLGVILNDARLAGLIDWDMIEDRTRNLESVAHWESSGEILRGAANQFRIDKWKDQKYRPEIWIEKEALAGVISSICSELDVSFLACRGYLSQSEMWSASQRILDRQKQSNQTSVVIYLGDHDPSGLDMSRDIVDRLEMFECKTVIVKRIALNFGQIEQFKPPSNPARAKDTRFHEYIKRFGKESWELDALSPKTLADLIRKEIGQWLDKTKWDSKVKEELKQRKILQKISQRLSDE